jgi:hypothetical protein
MSAVGGVRTLVDKGEQEENDRIDQRSPVDLLVEKLVSEAFLQSASTQEYINEMTASISFTAIADIAKNKEPIDAEVLQKLYLKVVKVLGNF